MDTSTLDFNTLTLLVAILVAIMGSTLTIVTLMFRQFRHFDNKFDSKFDRLDTRMMRLETKVTALDTKVTALDGRVGALDAKFDVMARDVSDTRERLARVEGHLMAPEGFTLRTPEHPEPGHRETG